MNVPIWVWLATCVGVLLLFAVDLILTDRRPHAITVKEASLWVAFYVTLAAAFAVGLHVFAGGPHTGEFVAGYLTEYSLSVDNLFVFVIIMSSFAVPKIHQHKVLLVGILIALVLRGAFIAAGAAAMARFDWVFYVFGAFLLYTAVKLATHSARRGRVQRERPAALDPQGVPDHRGVRRCPADHPHRRQAHVTPMLVVMVAIGTTDLLFALDSIPAIFGLTKEPYIVFTANAFALMGLRQLYFLLGGLLDRLAYLSHGLADHPRLHRRQAGPGDAPRARRAAGRRASRSASRSAVIVGVLALSALVSVVWARKHPVPAPH